MNSPAPSGRSGGRVRSLPMTRDRPARTATLRRLVLFVALVAFAVTAALGPFGTLCVCFGERDAPVDIGCCCCKDRPAPPPAEKDDEASMRVAKADACPCGDLKGCDLPAAPERAPDPLPQPFLASTSAAFVDLVVVATPTGAEFHVRPPPRQHPLALRNALRV
jgi:hypothetical protein